MTAALEVRGLVKAFGGATGIGVAVLPSVPAQQRLWCVATAVLVWAATVIILTFVFRRAGLDNVLDTMRHDRQVAIALGIRVRKIRLMLFLLSGAVAAAGGYLYVAFKQYVTASTFGLDMAVLVFVMVLVGRRYGALATITGACVLGLTPELLRIPAWQIPLRAGGLASLGVAEIWPLLFAAIIIAISRFSAAHD